MAMSWSVGACASGYALGMGLAEEGIGQLESESGPYRDR